MTSNYHIFNRSRVRMHRDRAARTMHQHDFLLKEMAARLADRLSDINRTFPTALDLGAHHGVLAAALRGRGGIETLVQTDLSYSLLCHSRESGNPVLNKMDPRVKPEDDRHCVVADEELLPFAENSFDLVMSCGTLHWVNDLPGTLIQIQRILKPDGLFLAMLPGGGTLMELRESLAAAETALTGGISPRVSPFVDVRDAGSLLQRAGFALPVVDSDVLTIEYEHPLKLLKDVQGMGEGNALNEASKTFTPRGLVMEAMQHYQKHFATPEGRVRASVELVALTGWKPHASQQQPAKRGSGTVHLKDVF